MVGERQGSPRRPRPSSLAAHSWHILRAPGALFLSTLLSMEAARTEWTDKRLDDLKAGMDEGFTKVEGRLDAVDGRINGLQQTMVIALIALCSMMFAGFGALITLFALHF